MRMIPFACELHINPQINGSRPYAPESVHSRVIVLSTASSATAPHMSQDRAVVPNSVFRVDNFPGATSGSHFEFVDCSTKWFHVSPLTQFAQSYILCHFVS